MQTFEWFSVGQKINYGFSSNLEEGVHVGLIKKIKGNMVAIIISNRDKEKVKPGTGETLHFFPEKDGDTWDVVGEVTQNASHPLLILKFDNEPASVSATEGAEEAFVLEDGDLDLPELDIMIIDDEDSLEEELAEEVATVEEPAEEDLGIVMEDDGDDIPSTLETEGAEIPEVDLPVGIEESDLPELDLASADQEEPSTEDLGIAIDGDGDDIPSTLETEGAEIPELDLPELDLTSVNQEEPSTDDFGIAMDDDDDDEPFELEAEADDAPELEMPEMDEEGVATDDFGIAMDDDDDDEPFALETDRTNISELDLPPMDEGDVDVEPVGIAMSDDEVEPDDDGPMLLDSDIDQEEGAPSLDIDSQDDESVEAVSVADEPDEDGPMFLDTDTNNEQSAPSLDIDSQDEESVDEDIDTISKEPAGDESFEAETVTEVDEPETMEGEQEVALGDMSQPMSGSEPDEKSLASEIEAATNGFNTIAATPFPDFFQVALHSIAPTDLSRIAEATESGDKDSGEQAFLDGIDLRSVDPDLQSVFSALLKKIGRVEKAVGDPSLSGPHENAICLLLKPKRAYLFSPKSFEVEESVALYVDHFWNPALSFRAVGSISLCESEVGGYVVTVSFTHLSPGAEENINAYLSRGREFYNNLSGLAKSKIAE